MTSAGRRPGRSKTREQILGAARKAFSDRGYDAATLREIAHEAGVDAAMIHYHFGNKEQLFLATMDIPFDPRRLITDVLDGPDQQLAERLLMRLLPLWDSRVGSGAIALLRTAVQHEWSARLLREFLLNRVLSPIMARLEDDRQLAQWRAALLASQVTGLLLTRYILKLEPIASAPHHVVAAALAPTLQRYLTGEVPPPPSPPTS